MITRLLCSWASIGGRWRLSVWVWRLCRPEALLNETRSAAALRPGN